MGWALGAELPAAPPDYSITVAFISALSVVLVALIGLAATWLSRSARTPDTPPAADPKLGERVAATAVEVQHAHRTLDVLDRHVDGLDTEVERLRWDMDDMKAWREGHQRQHGGLQ